MMEESSVIEMVENKNAGSGEARLKVIGVGGAGGNAVNFMIESEDCAGVEFIVANTDAQALANSFADDKIQLGNKITRGLGAGSDPEIGRRAAEEDIENLKEHIKGTEILFLAAGLGGGTGSGAMPVIARSAREMGILTVAVVTKPFEFEGKRRARHAEDAVRSLEEAADTMIVVPNEKLLEVSDPNISVIDAFALSNSILKHAVKGISDIIQKPGLINVDFADVRSVMHEMGRAIMGTGKCAGEDRAKKAAMQAIQSPLLENINIDGASGILLNITGNTSIALHEINSAASVIYDLAGENANIILGSVIDPSLNDEIMVTVIATGLSGHREKMVSPENASLTPAQVAQDKNVPNLIPESTVHELSVLQKTQTPVLEPNDQFDTHNLETLETPACMRREKTIWEENAILPEKEQRVE